MHRRALLLGFGALAACGPKPIPTPPSAPHVTSAAELIPADLDVVARLDLGRMKAALGGITPAALSREVLAQTAGKNGDEPDELIVTSLLDADLVYLGYRPSDELLPLDRVLALQGDFEPLIRPPAGFSGPTDLGADLRYWDRLPGKELPRTGVARLYALGERVRAFVSEAELDAVERVLDQPSEPHRLAAPEEGALSLAGRPRLLGRLAGGSFRELLEAAKTLQIVVDLESDGAKLKLTLVTADAAQAERLVAAGKLALARLLAERASKVELGAESDRVTLALRASRAELGAAWACWQGGSASASECPW